MMNQTADTNNLKLIPLEYRLLALAFLITESMCGGILYYIGNNQNLSNWILGGSLFFIFALNVLVLYYGYKTINLEKSREPIDIAANKYINGFSTDTESPIILQNEKATIDSGRAYRFLIYMFKCETFKEFFALDLAFCRWKELLDKNQTVNISRLILVQIEALLTSNRCESFQRVLVAYPDQLESEGGKKTLEYIRDMEKSCNEKLGGEKIETRVFVYSDSQYITENNFSSEKERIIYLDLLKLIHELHDFALFKDEPGIGIVEKDLTAPLNMGSVQGTNCDLCESRSDLLRLEQGFKSVWQKSITLPNYLEKLRNG